MSRRIICFVAAIIALGLALRLIGIERQPLWGDEGLTLLVVQSPMMRLFLAPIDPTPGLFFALSKLFVGVDASLLAMRSISLVAGTAAIAAIYTTARLSRIPALLAAALLALSFPLIDYSQEARAYSLLVLLVLLSGGTLIWWDRSRRTAALLSFATVTILSFYTHFVSVFWILPAVAGCIILAWRDPVARRPVALTLTLMAVLAIPEVNRLLHYNRGSFEWRAATPIEALNTLSYTQLPFGLFENDLWHLGSGLTALAGLACYGLLALLAVRHRRNLRRWARHNRTAAMVMTIWLAVPVAIWLFGYVAKPIFLPRTILIGVPGFILALSLLLKFEHRLLRFVVIGLFAISLALTGTVRPKEDWRPVTQLLASSVRRGDVVMLCPGWKVMAFRHAMRAAVDAPLVIMRNSGPMLIEPKLGSDPQWARSYFEALRSGGGVTEAQVALQNANRIWRIDSGCSR